MTPTARRRLVWVVAPVALLVGIGAYYWSRPVPKEPPAIDTAGVDPAVARAIESARDAVRAEPESAKAWGELGLVLFAHAMYHPSLPCFEEAERLDPGDPQWPYFQGMVYIFGNEVRALECFDRAVERAGTQVSPRVRRAETLLALERWEQAKEAFEDARRRQPGHPRVALGLARLAARAGDWDRCVALLTPLTDDPSCRRAARTLLAEVAARRGDPAAAAAHHAALADLPKDAHWDDPYLEAVHKRQVGLFQRLDRAAALQGRRRHVEAEDLVLNILKTDPRSDEAHFLLARIYLATGDAARGEAAALQGLAIAPKTSSGHFLVGSARFLKGDVDGAETAFRTAAELQPDYAIAHYSIGECRRNRNDPRGAAAAYREALRYRPNMVEAHVALGAALLDAGDTAAARTHLQDALRLRPDDAEAGRLLKKVGGP